MGFEIFQPSRVTVGMGSAAMDGSGNLTLNSVDLQTIGVRDEVAILIDRPLKRLAVRAAKSSEPTRRITFNKSKNAAKVNVRGALVSMGIKLQARKFSVMNKENLLILNLQ